MKSYLLDTHIFLWAYTKPEKLGKKVSRILVNTNNAKFISAISLIEIAQLYETKSKEFDVKIPLATYINQGLVQMQIQVLAITPEHSQRYYKIQALKNHNDPFDRVIVAQAASTGFTAISDDENVPFYPIELISND